MAEGEEGVKYNTIRANGTFGVGYMSNNNSVLVSGETRFQTGNTYIGQGDGGATDCGNGNSMTLSGHYAQWRVKDSNGDYANVIVGANGSGNSLAIKDGANARMQTLVVGYGKAMMNTVEIGSTVEGRTSSLICSGDLLVGYYGNANLMTVKSGGRVSADNLLVGTGVQLLSGYSIANRFVVSGAGSFASFATSVQVGARGMGNLMIVEDGGHVVAEKVIVGGHGSGNALTVGEYACGSSLYVTNGSKVSCGSLIVSFSIDESAMQGPGNIVSIDGEGSLLTCNGNLVLGAGHQGLLAVDNGAGLYVGGGVYANSLTESGLYLGNDSYLMLAGELSASALDEIFALLKIWDPEANEGLGDWVAATDKNTFAVYGHTSDDVWTATGGLYSFDDATVISGHFMAVPEPSQWALAVGAGALLLAFRRRAAKAGK
jgi:T5SS/PEP-CTERM-associated repeat protein